MAKRFLLHGANQTRGGRVSWCLRELGQDFDQVDDGPVGMGLPGANYDPKYNPNLTVPTLLVRGEGSQDSVGFSLYESFAVTQYLCKTLESGKEPLMGPRTLEEDAKIAQFSMWALTTIEIPTLALLTKNPTYVERSGGLAAATGTLTAGMRVLDAELEGKEYLVGGRFTVADLNCGAIVANWLSGAKFDFSPFPNVEAWVTRLRDRPHFRPPKKAKL